MMQAMTMIGFTMVDKFCDNSKKISKFCFVT